MEQPEVGEKVDDLLLAEVAAPGRAIRREAFAPKGLLVAFGVGPGGEEDDDLSRIGLARVDELANATRDSPRLSLAPVLTGPGEARLVGDEQLDRMAEHRIGELRRRRQRLEVVAERVGEEMVDRVEHLRARPIVLRQREQAWRLRASLTEDLEVGMPEPVDRLELVADREHLGEIRMRDEVDHLALEPVRVLELVDHDHAEPEPGRFANVLVVAKQVAGGELEILEVDDRLASLRSGVLDAEALEKLLQQIAIVRRELLERRPLGCLARPLERRGARTLARERREIDESLGRRSIRGDEKDLARVPALRRSRRHVGRELRGLGAQRVDRVLGARALTELEDEVAARRAERLVDAREHAPQPVGTVRREEPQPLRLSGRAELLQRALECLSSEHGCTRLLDLAEARIEPCGKGMRAQHATAEPVDGRDPRAVEIASEIGAAALAKSRADAAPKLTCRLARVRDHEDRLDVDAPLAHRPDVALDEHRRLPRSRARGDEDRALRVDGGQLLIVEPRG